MFDFIKVKAIAVSQPVCDFIPDSEGILSYSARVSNPQNQTNFDTAGKLLAYCAKNSHWSVFETASLTMEIECPRDIARQILRHRSFSFQEFSGRYAEMQEFITRECRLQDEKNRQNSVETDDELLAEDWRVMQQSLLETTQQCYQWALSKGIAKEVARTILPEGLTMSKLYMQGTVRSWMHYINIRDDEGVTQKEHVDVARKCRAEFIKYFPSLEQYV